MKNFLKKTILLFTLAGIVFFGGGVGVAQANNHPQGTTVTPATNTSTNYTDSEKSMVEAVRTQNTTSLDLIHCGGFWDKLSLGCIMPVITYTLYVVIAGVLTLSGELFDFMLNLSINGVFIEQDFINILWKVVRDFSNMVFIFALLYAGIRTMLWMDDWKKPIMMVVVIALLINFSLFFTKIVIDAGNVLAMGVYSSMGVTKETSVSAAFVNNFAPQQFFSLAANKIDLAPTIFIIAGIAGGFLAWVLFKASFLFLGRIIGFWALMILSPFAFITLAFPMLGAKVKFSFSAWIDMLIAQAFVAPVFLFFLYIIMTVVQSKPLANFGAPSGSGALMDLLFKPALFAVMIVFALKQALKVAENMSGEFGKIGADLGNKAFGLAAMGTGVGLTAGVGAVAGSALRSGTLKKMVDSDNMLVKRFGGRVEQVLKGAHEKPMDFRNISIGGKKVGEHLGIESFGLKEGYKQSKEGLTKMITDTGKTASEERIAAQTTRKDAAETAKENRIKAEEGGEEARTKREVSRVTAQTPGGRAAKTSKDEERAFAASPQGIATAANRAGDYEAKKEATRLERKISVDTTIPAQGTPGTPGYTPEKKSLNKQLEDMKENRVKLQNTDLSGLYEAQGGPKDGEGGTLQFAADSANEDLVTAKKKLDSTPTTDPNYAVALKAHTYAKVNKRLAEKQLEDFKKGADNIEKLEKKIEEYKAL